MIRDEVLRISKCASFRGISKVDITLILINYCIEHGKDPSQAQLFVTYLLGTPLLWIIFKFALSFWEKKFNINKLYSQPQIGEVEGSRKLLLIY